MKIKESRLIRLFIALGGFTAGVGLVAFLFWQLGVFEEFINIQEFGSSVYGHIMYFTAYIFAKLSLFIPLGPIVVAFNQVAPNWSTILVGGVAEVIGGVLLYTFGFFFGVRLIEWVAGEKALKKWGNILEKGKYTIFLSFLFPFSPNQVVMMLCGSGRMKLRQYLPMVAIAQPIGVATTVYGFKALTILKPLWLFLPLGFGIILITMYMSYRYQHKIDWLMDKVLRRGKHDKN